MCLADRTKDTVVTVIRWLRRRLLLLRISMADRCVTQRIETDGERAPRHRGEQHHLAPRRHPGQSERNRRLHQERFIAIASIK